LAPLSPGKKNGKAHGFIWAYFGLTFAWSWAFWIPTVLLELDTHHFLTQLGFGLGGLGPALFGIFFTYKEGGRKILPDYFRRIWDWKNLTPFWWGMALLMVPALTWVAGEIDSRLGGRGLEWDFQVFNAAPSFPFLLTIPATIIFFLFFGPVPEEMGWRGYALDRLQEKRGPWAGSLLLGLIWGLWHLPLFFMGGSFQNTLSFGTVGFWLFFAAVMAVSLIMTWIYNHTGRSILAAILFHFACNLSSETMGHGNRLEALRILLCLLWVFLAAVWGRDGFLGYPARKES
jgi:membrane protease YdiL (CAAX protease family)